MLDPARVRTAPDKAATVQITPVSRTLLLMKSWLPEHTSGSKPVVLAGQELPSPVGATTSGSLRALCTGPGEWLIASPTHRNSSLRDHIEPDLPQQGLLIVDLSDGLAALEVRGSAVRELLSKGCGLDLHPRSFPAGRCARTRFAQISVVIVCLDESPRFELYVARSYSHYLQSWLGDAAVEFADVL